MFFLCIYAKLTFFPSVMLKWKKITYKDTKHILTYQIQLS